MMNKNKVCRVGDTGSGVCPGHKVPTPFVTVFANGTNRLKVDGKDVVVVGTIGDASCGCKTTAMTGSKLFKVDGKGIHRVGDTGVTSGGGTYTVDSGSDTTFCE